MPYRMNMKCSVDKDPKKPPTKCMFMPYKTNRWGSCSFGSYLTSQYCFKPRRSLSKSITRRTGFYLSWLHLLSCCRAQGCSSKAWLYIPLHLYFGHDWRRGKILHTKARRLKIANCERMSTLRTRGTECLRSVLLSKTVRRCGWLLVRRKSIVHRFFFLWSCLNKYLASLYVMCLVVEDIAFFFFRNLGNPCLQGEGAAAALPYSNRDSRMCIVPTFESGLAYFKKCNIIIYI